MNGKLRLRINEQRREKSEAPLNCSPRGGADYHVPRSAIFVKLEGGKKSPKMH